MKRRIAVIFLLAVANWQLGFADSVSETNTSHYFDRIKSDSSALSIFIDSMPKGGDLHNHRSGSSYAENLLSYALDDPQACIDPVTFAVTESKHCQPRNKLSAVAHDWLKRNELIDEWSMRDYRPGTENAHDHFFNTFFKFADVTAAHRAQTLTEITERAGEQNEIYLEAMITTDIEQAMDLGKKINLDDNFATAYQQLEKLGIGKIVANVNQQIAQEQTSMRAALLCNTPEAKPGCKVTQRYQMIALRTVPSNEFFAQLVLAFQVAATNPLVVGVNIVGAEDDYYAVKDYHLHMLMFDFLHQKFPNVKIALHAGELWPGLVPPNALHNHIADAINTGHASRIGHGVDIQFETNAKQTIASMASQQIPVEINLTSNADILGVQGKEHPFLFYIYNKVPVVLSTDDEGVLRTNLSREYQRAVQTYDLSYPMLKMLARNSLTYAFIPGESLWLDPASLVPVDACAKVNLGEDTSNTACNDFLTKSEKARLQWQLEKQFNEFEQAF